MKTQLTMKTKIFTLVLLAFTGLSNLYAQVGIGTTTPAASSILDVESTTQGFLPPRMETSDRDAIASPAEGLTIFNTESGCLEFYNGTLWVSACDGSLQPGPLSDCSTSGFIAPFIAASETEIVDVNVSTISGTQTWMDRNLGAITDARASNDCYAYGNLHQWGRDSDGHEDRNSNVTSGPVAAGNEGSDFKTSNSGTFDWLSTQDATRWDGATKGVHDPCPAGYRVPTEAELSDLDASFGAQQNAAGAFASPLKLSAAGFRSRNTGNFFNVGSSGSYWSSSVDVADAHRLFFNSGDSNIGSSNRALGNSVRCIKD
jgi:uncharacterized protein (TIGR02145 family)